MAEMNGLGKLMSAFIIILVGVVFSDVIADETKDVTISSLSVLNETLALNNSMGHQIANATLRSTGVIGLSAVRNVSSKDITSYCNVNLWAANHVNCTNTGDGTAYADYTFEPVDYVNSTVAATILDLVILFFVLAIMAIGIGLAISAFKDMGLV